MFPMRLVRQGNCLVQYPHKGVIVEKKKSYDALANWVNNSKRPEIRKILIAEGLKDVVARLDAAATSAVAEIERKLLETPKVKAKE